jgi:hypothetical protein
MIPVGFLSMSRKMPECYLEIRHKRHLPNPYPHSIHDLQPTTEIEKEARRRKQRRASKSVNLHQILRRNKSEMVRWALHVARFREVINSYILVGKRKGKGSVGRSKRRWEDNIKTDFKEVMCVGFIWPRLRIASCEDVNGLSGSIRDGLFLTS